MKKSELKTNMLVETRSHRRYLVKKDLPVDVLNTESDFIINETGGLMSFHDYSEDLLCYDNCYNQTFYDENCCNHPFYDYGRNKMSKPYDIMKVYIPRKFFAFTSEGEFNLDNYELLWEREEPKDEPKEDPPRFKSFVKQLNQ